ncbi:hypothetical protein D3C85_1462410 [compost metagenome]
MKAAAPALNCWFNIDSMRQGMAIYPIITFFSSLTGKVWMALNNRKQLNKFQNNKPILFGIKANGAIKTLNMGP